MVARTLTLEVIQPILPRYLGLEFVYFVLYAALLWKLNLPGWLKHLYLVIQCGLVLLILSLRPQFDFVVVLFFLLSYQASLFFTDRMRWGWALGLVFLTGGSLIFYLGFLKGLALALTTMAVEIVFPAYLMVNQDTEKARVESQLLLNELQVTRQQLQTYANQAEELAAIQERSRLSRELHDTVNQFIFSVALTSRSAQLLLERDPARVPEQLTRIQQITSEALSQLRSLISQLHLPQNP